jgi:hypothetical protein
MTQPIAAHRDDARERDFKSFARRRNTRNQPWDFTRVRKAKDEFVDDAIDAHGARDKRRRCVGRVGEDEMVCVKGCEVGFTYATTASVLVLVIFVCYS